MKLTQGLMIGFTAATLFAQDFPEIDTTRIKIAVMEDMRRVQQEMEAQKDMIADIPRVLLQAKEAMAFAKPMPMPMPFFQGGGKDGGGKYGAMTQDEELKAMAIDSLMQSDSERAIPLLDKLLQNQQTSMPLRLRALHALGNSDSTKARDIVVRVAKDGSNADLQSRALRMLGSRESSQNKQLLGEIFASSTNADIKRQVLRSWMAMGAKDQILNVAKSDSNPEVRGAAINHLGGMRANAELGSLYAAESSTEIRERLLRALAGGGDWQKLIEIAKTEKNTELRDRAIRLAGSANAPGASEALVALYAANSDATVRESILRALSSQGSAKQLIALARKETNPDLKRSALRHLSRMKGDEVATYLTELLGN